MRTLQENLTQYAAYHRDRRNIATHFVGVPLIVFSVILALNEVHFSLGSMQPTLAVVVAVAAILYYVSQDVVLGLTMAVIFVLMCAGASEITARTTTGGALAWAFLIFTVGWAIQFLGHKWKA